MISWPLLSWTGCSTLPDSSAVNALVPMSLTLQIKICMAFSGHNDGYLEEIQLQTCLRGQSHLESVRRSGDLLKEVPSVIFAVIPVQNRTVASQNL